MRKGNIRTETLPKMRQKFTTSMITSRKVKSYQISNKIVFSSIIDELCPIQQAGEEPENNRYKKLLMFQTQN